MYTFYKNELTNKILKTVLFFLVFTNYYKKNSEHQIIEREELDKFNSSFKHGDLHCYQIEETVNDYVNMSVLFGRNNNEYLENITLLERVEYIKISDIVAFSDKQLAEKIVLGSNSMPSSLTKVLFYAANYFELRSINSKNIDLKRQLLF